MMSFGLSGIPRSRKCEPVAIQRRRLRPHTWWARAEHAWGPTSKNCGRPRRRRFDTGAAQGTAGAPIFLPQAAALPSSAVRPEGFLTEVEPPIDSAFWGSQISAAASLVCGEFPTEASCRDPAPSAIRRAAGKLNLAAFADDARGVFCLRRCSQFIFGFDLLWDLIQKGVPQRSAQARRRLAPTRELAESASARLKDRHTDPDCKSGEVGWEESADHAKRCWN